MISRISALAMAVFSAIAATIYAETGEPSRLGLAVFFGLMFFAHLHNDSP